MSSRKTENYEHQPEDGGQKQNSGEDYDIGGIIFPIAPKPSYENAEQSGINSTPAFQCIDDLLTEGKITGAKAAWYKSKYQDLLQQLKLTRETESKCLHEGKELMQLVQKQQSDIEQGELFPAGVDNEANRLRADLLKSSNELAACNERIYQLDFNMNVLKEEKRLLENEFERLPKKEEIDKKIKDYTQEIEELRLDIAQRLHECKSLKDEQGTRNEQAELIHGDLEKLESDEQKLKDKLVKIYGEPAHISKQCELVNRQIRDLLEKNKLNEANVTEVDAEFMKFCAKKDVLLIEKEQLAKALENQRSLYEEKEKEVDLLMKECDLAKERQAELLGDRTSLDLKIKHVKVDKKTEHDAHARKLREKDRDLKILKKADVHLKVMKDGLAHTKNIYDKIKIEVDLQPRDDGTLMEKRRELQREVDIAKRAFTQQNSLTLHEKQVVEKGCQEEDRLLCEQGQLRIDVIDLSRLSQIKTDEREQKARDFLKAELRYHKAIEDLKTKELSIQDNAKKLTEVQRRLEDFAKLYDIIKNERNKCVNLIQTSTQRAAEMQEKIKILQNEIEILRTAAAAKDRQYQKAKLKHSNAVVIRDSLRNEVSKQQISAEELREQMEQQRLAISKLNDMINKAEENMVELRRQYELSVQERNKRGIQLIERNEEVCVLYEKINVQGSVIRNGDMEMQSREEEMRFLKMEASDLRRQIDLLKGSLPNKQALDRELTTLQIQLAQCHDYIVDLEHSLEDSGNVDRMRFLDGKDPTRDELATKVETLGLRLAKKEEQLLEKELVHEQITRLVSKVKSKTNNDKEDTLVLAKSVNEVQSKIKDTTRKMMAMVSELSMNQANTIKLGQDVKAKETLLEQCYARMERGQPPSDEIEDEWLNGLKKEINRIQAVRERKKDEETMEQYQIAGGITTTAEPRPNAYIPDDGNDLPLPRPYGASAPFKPTEPGSNMRHIRKPVIKPIEI